MPDVVEELKKMSQKKGFENKIYFQQLLEKCKTIALSSADVEFLTELYSLAKKLYIRNTIMMSLVFCEDIDLKDFFFKAFKKERYLDMRLTAIRGYANYATEKEVEKLMSKFIEILMKRPENTPYNYQEYELIRSAFGLPYLVNRFRYACFIQAYAQEEKQYNVMPDAFKGHFTIDEKGNSVQLRSPEETTKMLDEFWGSK
ncbi:hypothetical protein [Paenibacillus sp. IHBB 10380]|uniref:hypothetical protein n=1 Tax=Paenibacillus sp. IHBB 10380 TaxID=1566358 RepID=UPI0005CFD1A2|nr:hypothetical protein [Paenibacillus sp. IHBB 10380]AJS57229.1 hypothetical protein UB51_00515 [Paenibacillus sp. IHBB 10380]